MLCEGLSSTWGLGQDGPTGARYPHALWKVPPAAGLGLWRTGLAASGGVGRGLCALLAPYTSLQAAAGSRPGIMRGSQTASWGIWVTVGREAGVGDAAPISPACLPCAAKGHAQPGPLALRETADQLKVPAKLCALLCMTELSHSLTPHRPVSKTLATVDRQLRSPPPLGDPRRWRACQPPSDSV